MYIFLLIFGGCAKDPIRSEITKNPQIQVDELFTHDSITVYRFEDNGRYVYFCKDWTKTSHSCGKGCTYDTRVETK